MEKTSVKTMLYNQSTFGQFDTKIAELQTMLKKHGI
jgi:hypothetical protein